MSKRDTSEFVGHPREPETFTFTERQEGPNGLLRIIRSHVAYDSCWPWWRRLIADLSGRR